jgi:hypothetical protein
MTTMEETTNRRITRLEFKDEGENEEGMVIGKLTDQDADPVFADGRWVTKKDALRIARDLGVELFEY